MVTFEIQKGYFRVWDGKTSYNLLPWEKENHPNFLKEYDEKLPDLDRVYNLCQQYKLSSEQTIDFMLKVFFLDRLVKNGYLHDLSLVVAFIGPRGSGKSVGAAEYAILDYLLDGKPVWSNMNIELKVKYRDCEKIFRSMPLDKAALMDINDFESQFADGLILIDELNIEIGDARRSMSNTMLWFDFMLQEVRKRKMNICYTVQAEEWAGSRSRWQTDLYIACRDAAFIKGRPTKDTIGRHSRWRIYDMSGIMTGDIKYSTGYDRNKVDWFTEMFIWNTPFWNTYNTTQIQAYEKFDPTKKDVQNGQITIDERTFKALTAGYNVLPEMIVRIIDNYQNRILRSDVWRILGVDDQATKTKIGELLHSLGATDYRTSNGGRGYVLPDKETLNSRLRELGVEIF